VARLAATFERSAEMRAQDRSADAPVGIRVLVADDDAQVRSLFAALLQASNGVASVIEAGDGADAVELCRKEQVEVAVLDLNMPRLDGVEAVLRLRALQPSPRIALHSSDAELLRQRAADLGLPLFDKVDFERLREWVERQATGTCATGATGSGLVTPMAAKVDLCCPVCGYGIVCRTPPGRCPMCGGEAGWSERRSRTPRRATVDERFAG
jgi:CheY-like chemotaxis protein